MERLKQRSEVVSFTGFLFVCFLFVFVFQGRGEQHNSECVEGYGQRKQEYPIGENCSSQDLTE